MLLSFPDFWFPMLKRHWNPTKVHFLKTVGTSLWPDLTSCWASAHRVSHDGILFSCRRQVRQEGQGSDFWQKVVPQILPTWHEQDGSCA